MANKMSYGASSSSRRWKYDVFLSFRGRDTRSNFIDFLYTALAQSGIHTFREEEELNLGEDISSKLMAAIEGSRIAIIVFSENYASSTWCLRELVKILECKKDGRTEKVLPVFYHMDPSDVKKQRNSYAEAFKRHEERFKNEMAKVETWRTALTEAANLKGWAVANGNETTLIGKIVEHVLSITSQTHLHVAEYPIGLDSHIERIACLLNDGMDVRTIGICGLGGIGKTTIAKAVFNVMFTKFEGSSFLANVRDASNQQKGLALLQKQLLSDVLKEKYIDLDNEDQGINIIKERLRYKKVLIVLDDVDEMEQFDKLVGGCFGPGSRIILTTRDEHLLNVLKVDEKYMVQTLDQNKALQLFNRYAFRQDHPLEGFEQLSDDAINYARGLPLTLMILGSHLREKSEVEWKSELMKLGKIPNDPILEKLDIYDVLDDFCKTIFLDISCFFIGKDKDIAIKILDGCGLPGEAGIKLLTERSLVTIDEDSKLCMNNLIRDMGREIVRRQSPENPEDRSRLWDQDDVLDVLRNLRGTDAIEGLQLKGKEFGPLKTEGFSKMPNLKLLEVDCPRSSVNIDLGHSFQDGGFFFRNLVWVCWKEFPFEYIPNHFHLGNLVILDMQESKLKEVWKETRNLAMLKELNLSKSPYLKRTPDFSKLSNLEKLILNGCKSLVKVHKTIGLLKKLVYLDLGDCSDLRNLPSGISKLALLETLDVSCCSNLSNLPSGISFCSKLETLNMWNCPRLKSLPMLPSSLRSLYASCCNKLRRIPNLSNSKYLMKLDLSRCEKLTEIGGLDGLKSATTIKLNDCVNLKTSIKKRIFQEISKDVGNTEVCKIIMGGNEVPEWFGFQSESPSLSCEVTRLHNMDIQGLIICIVCSHTIREEWLFDNDFKVVVAVFIESKNSTWSHRSEISLDRKGMTTYAIKIPNSVWETIAEYGNTIKVSIEGGSHYDVKSGMVKKIGTKKIGVHFLYVSQENPQASLSIQRCGFLQSFGRFFQVQ
ncbi:disease resistance protein RPV1-like [Macadamia integrifolia]|uniref:disease resistance protein RPV1-like n=1 Tax=Macadamia integrifolia TaxID=60698 RepID=UPI001C52ABF8|nr:disease resistance protein RPV1-like [Macadamia integrifolia]